MNERPRRGGYPPHFAERGKPVRYIATRITEKEYEWLIKRYGGVPVYEAVRKLLVEVMDESQSGKDR